MHQTCCTVNNLIPHLQLFCSGKILAKKNTALHLQFSFIWTKGFWLQHLLFYFELCYYIWAYSDFFFPLTEPYLGAFFFPRRLKEITRINGKKNFLFDIRKYLKELFLPLDPFGVTLSLQKRKSCWLLLLIVSCLYS